MDENKSSYLEKQIEAVMKNNDDGYSFIFQRAKLSMQNPLELQLIQEIDPVFHKNIEVSEDEVKISIIPPASFFAFDEAGQKSSLNRWIACYQIIKKIRGHELTRLQVIVCPENLVFDQGFTPYFLHYGVKESLPPYEQDAKQLFEETKATIAALVDRQYTFDQYLLYHKTLKLSKQTQSILAEETWEGLTSSVQKRIAFLEKEQKTFVHIPEKKWKIERYTLWGIGIILVPLLFFTIYTLFFSNPRQEAYVESGENFLKQEYSQVIDRLENYNPEKMPYVVQYELSKSYVTTHGSLMDFQKENILKAITLQTDSQYLLYWIYIGRGVSEDAINLARIMEDRELIMYGLLTQKEQIKSNEDLTGEEKETQVKEVDTELKEYEKEMEEYQKQLEEANLLEQQDQPSTESNRESVVEPEAKPAVKEDEEKKEPASKEKKESKEASEKPAKEKEKENSKD
ncbi:type VII secretion protein EssB [Peribacillus sp. NPDC097295]|uniref:type VII secretion protein EssB n=1 Tax=Peribacillus sp. NPDC097295 TaxID=3364402 RepID=UPI0037F38249